MFDIFLNPRRILCCNYGVDKPLPGQTNFVEFDINNATVTIFQANTLEDKASKITLSHEMFGLMVDKLREHQARRTQQLNAKPVETDCYRTSP